ncbi:MAG: hypothetical protein ACOYKN_13950 [Pirellula sp.]
MKFLDRQGDLLDPPNGHVDGIRIRSALFNDLPQAASANELHPIANRLGPQMLKHIGDVYRFGEFTSMNSHTTRWGRIREFLYFIYQQRNCVISAVMFRRKGIPSLQKLLQLFRFLQATQERNLDRDDATGKFRIWAFPNNSKASLSQAFRESKCRQEVFLRSSSPLLHPIDQYSIMRIVLGEAPPSRVRAYRIPGRLSKIVSDGECVTLDGDFLITVAAAFVVTVN